MDDIIHPDGPFIDDIWRVWYVLLGICPHHFDERKLVGIQIILVDHTPRESLGAANGLAQAVASGLRGVAPSVASSLFSISLEQRLLGGHFVFYFLVAVALTGMRIISFLPTSKDSHSD